VCCDLLDIYINGSKLSFSSHKIKQTAKECVEILKIIPKPQSHITILCYVKSQKGAVLIHTVAEAETTQMLTDVSVFLLVNPFAVEARKV
jgi:hypothetical protein